MCYRCEICAAVVPPRRQRLLHQVMRTVDGNPQIAREFAVCEECHYLLDTLDASLEEVVKQRGRKVEVGITAPGPDPLPPEPVKLGQPVSMTGRIISTMRQKNIGIT